jgi:hypothetical protein
MNALLRIANFALLVLIAIAPSITPASADEQPDVKTLLRIIGQARSIHVRSSVTTMLGIKEVNYSFVGKRCAMVRDGTMLRINVTEERGLPEE